jgi:hypothetical protein
METCVLHHFYQVGIIKLLLVPLLNFLLVFLFLFVFLVVLSLIFIQTTTDRLLEFGSLEAVLDMVVDSLALEVDSD